MAKPPEFDPIATILMLRKAEAHYHNLPAFAVGDLVESFDPGNARDLGQKAMPMIVLDIIADLEQINKDPGFRGVPGVRVMMPDVDSSWLDTEVRIFPAWHVTPYAGPRPHQQ